MLSSLFIEVADKIKSATSICVLHDADADGIGAALITNRAVVALNPQATVSLFALKNKIIPPKETPLQKNDLLIVLDYDLSNYDLLEQYKEVTTNIVIIDHHIIKQKTIDALRINPHEQNHPLGSHYNTGMLCYDGFKEHVDEDTIDWIACATVLGDFNMEFHQKLLLEKAQKYNITVPQKIADWFKTPLYTLTFITECARATSMDAVRTLTEQLKKIQTYQEIQNYTNPYEQASLDAHTYIDEYKRHATVDVENQIIWLRIESKFAIGSWVSTLISTENQNMLYIVSHKENNIFKVSARSQSGEVDCAELLHQATQNIQGAMGGGHPQAAGAAVPIDAWKTFQKNIYSYLGDDEQSEE